jgi:putative cell wall-binding protein
MLPRLRQVLAATAAAVLPLTALISTPAVAQDTPAVEVSAAATDQAPEPVIFDLHPREVGLSEHRAAGTLTPNARPMWPTNPNVLTGPVDLPCAGDGTSGPRIQFWYAHVQGETNRLAQARGHLTEQIKRANGQLVGSANQTGGYRALRVVTDKYCNPTFRTVTLSPSALDDLYKTRNELKAKAGLQDDPDRINVILLDAIGFQGGVCGRGTAYVDDRKDPAVNYNNTLAQYGRIDVNCWTAHTILHEIFHNLGAVQPSAPHAQDFHCTDENDLMCYGANMTLVCKGALAEERLDCNKDDYFNTAPKAGNYLATHWNTADSKFLYKTTPTLYDLYRYQVLQEGSTGTAVELVQEQLKKTGHYTGAVNGVYGSTTTAAVRSYQAAKLLEVTGTIAENDWKALSDKPYTKVTPASRLAGKDRYETAAAVAATYSPGVEVAYVATGADFPDAIGAAAAAGRDDAPVLLTKAQTLPPSTAAQLQRLKPNRIVVMGSDGVIADSVLAQLVPLTRSGAAGSVTRLAGSDRYATSAAIAGTYNPATTDTVYVASGADFPDALSGAALAGSQDAPVLLTRADTIPTAVRSAIQRLAPKQIVILGGETRVSASVARDLAALTQSKTSGRVTRLAGSDRYATSVAVAKKYPAGVPAVYVASGADFPDALAGAALAGSQGVPVLLTRPTALPGSTRLELPRLAPASATVIGSTGAVSETVRVQLGSFLPR